MSAPPIATIILATPMLLTGYTVSSAIGAKIAPDVHFEICLVHLCGPPSLAGCWTRPSDSSLYEDVNV